MSKHRHVVLTDEQRDHLNGLMRRGVVKARTVTRARILLLADRSQGHKNTDAEIAASLLCSASSVFDVRHRYLDKGMDAALYESFRPGAKPKITGEVEAQLVALACSDPPEGRSRWTLRLLADQLVELGLVESISHVAVGERLKKRTQTLAGR